MPRESTKKLTLEYGELEPGYHTEGRELGNGGYGKVFVVYCNKKSYALKKIQKEDKEIEKIKGLEHKNICRILNSWENNQFRYLVFEKYDGDLSEIVENMFIDTDILPQIPHIIDQLYDAVIYIHSKNICHMDIKLENILYKWEGEEIKIVLSDFSLSRPSIGVDDYYKDFMMFSRTICKLKNIEIPHSSTYKFEQEKIYQDLFFQDNIRNDKIVSLVFSVPEPSMDIIVKLWNLKKKEKQMEKVRSKRKINDDTFAKCLRCSKKMIKKNLKRHQQKCC